MALAKQENKGLGYWVHRISDEEMPALCSMVKSLESLSEDDISSLSKLGRSVMHDNGLTSRILRVANSVIYNKGRNQITTVSRAAVVLGFNSLRNICLTARLISSLLESRELDPRVHRRLLARMAGSFQAAMLARMMQPELDEQGQEEVFIAALLYHLGESAFLSTGAEDALFLVNELDLANSEDVNTIVRRRLGTSFNQLTQGLASQWGLGELLTRSLKDPLQRTGEVQCIYLANAISDAMTRGDEEQLASLVTKAASVVEMPEREFRAKVQRCTHATMKLAEAYGAKGMADYLRETTDKPLEVAHGSEDQQQCVGDDATQLMQLRKLSALAESGGDFNEVVMTTLTGLKDGVGLNHCGVFLLSRDRNRLLLRIVLGLDDRGQQLLQELPLDSASVFEPVIKLKQPLRGDIGISEPVNGLVAGGLIAAPLVVESKVIGIFYGANRDKQTVINDEQYGAFLHFTRQANLCFALSRR
ncbi:HDOD domain-containing protein [Shewanella corallii]|uniref:HDOD domain-containing protein n=1 Tax=Shewanella corallii TaxID=560080 RepID=A0ABT0NAF2_9GAMM|nr:HDOD domain-containing protein [Shewanella corallii]